MKRYVDCLIVAVGVAILSAAPLANARGGFGGHGPQGGHWGGYNGGGHFDHGHFYGHSGFFFGGVFPFPFWYPYYGSPYDYYYDYPAPYYYDSGPSVSYYNNQTPIYPAVDTRSYLVLGHDTGKSLRNKSVTWDWFVEYLQAYVVNAPQWARDDFQRGFVSGYGDNAESIYNKGIQQVRQLKAPSAEGQPPSRQNSNYSQR
jgi:hypothetical protein